MASASPFIDPCLMASISSRRPLTVEPSPLPSNVAPQIVAVANIVADSTVDLGITETKTAGTLFTIGTSPTAARGCRSNED
jgi:hypothetical protein